MPPHHRLHYHNLEIEGAGKRAWRRRRLRPPPTPAPPAASADSKSPSSQLVIAHHPISNRAYRTINTMPPATLPMCQKEEVEGTEEGGGSRGSRTASNVSPLRKRQGPLASYSSVCPGPGPDLPLAPPSPACAATDLPPPAEPGRIGARDTGPDVDGEDGAEGAGSPTEVPMPRHTYSVESVFSEATTACGLVLCRCSAPKRGRW
jgi:hypothetical protein